MATVQEILVMQQRMSEQFKQKIAWTFVLEKITDIFSYARLELIFMGMQITEKNPYKSSLYLMIGFALMIFYPTMYNTCSYFRRRAMRNLGKEYCVLARNVAGISTAEIQDFENKIQEALKNV